MRVLPAIAVLVLFAASSCTRQEAAFGPPRVVDKEQRQIQWDVPLRDRMGMSSSMPKESGGEWAATVPPGWEQLPSQPSRFRELLFRVAGQPDTECYLTAGVGGGVAMNMRRWYVDQGGLSEVPAPETLPLVDFGGNPARLAEITGTIGGKPDQAMLIVFGSQGDVVTTLKFTGPANQVLPQKDNFLLLAKSVRRGPAGAAAGAAAGTGTQTGAASGWQATVPVGWEQLPSQPSRFRDLLFRVVGRADTECYLTGGVGGGVVMNMQRWYVQQAGRSEAPTPESLPAAMLGDKPARLAEITGTIGGKPDQAMLIVFAAQGDVVSTLKFTGPADVVLAEKENFLSLAQSIRTGPASPGGAAQVAPAGPLPANHAPTPPPTPAHAGAAPFTATVPAGWTAKTDTPRLLHHTFGNDGEVYVSQLGGTPRQMFDIWRGEISAGQLDDRQFADLEKLPMLGGEGLLMDVSGEFRSMTGKQIPNARLLVAAFSGGGSITFVKLVGPAADVESQVKAFREFCASLRRSM